MKRDYILLRYVQKSVGRYCRKLYEWMFRTICVRDPRVELTEYGKIADKYIKQLNDHYENVSVEQYVIMPNHIHMILFVRPCGSSRTPTPTSKANAAVPAFISTFKRFCNKEYGENIWQRYYYDHVIRDHRDYEKISEYIRDNPLHWQDDELYNEI